jgi:AAHS family 3-hydroxyphenylpropionic acid transporter
VAYIPENASQGGGQLGVSLNRLALVIPICFAVSALDGYDVQTVGVAAPMMMPAIHVSPDAAGAAFSASMMGLILGSVFCGWLADRLGRKPILLAAVTIFGVFSLATMGAHNATSLFWLRFATGLGLGGVMPNLIAIASEASDPSKRTRVTTSIFAGMPVGGAAAALVAAQVSASHHWQNIFLVGGLLPLLVVPIVFLWLPETRQSKPDRELKNDVGVFSGLFGEGRLTATLLIWVMYALTNLTLHLLLNWLPTLLVGKGLATRDASLAALLFSVGGITGSLVMGWIVDRMGFRWPVTLGYVALVATMCVLAIASGTPSSFLLSIIAGFLIMGVQFVLYGVVGAYYPSAVVGTAAGAAVGAGRVGSIIGPLMAGALLGNGASEGSVIASTAPIILAAGAASLLLSYVAHHYRQEPRAGLEPAVGGR